MSNRAYRSILLVALGLPAGLLPVPSPAQDDLTMPTRGSSSVFSNAQEAEKFRELMASAMVHMNKKEYKEAISSYLKARKVNNKVPEIYAGLSSALIQMGSDARAVKILEQLCRRYPNKYEFRNNLAWVYSTTTDRSLRNGPRAVELAREALLVSPSNYHVWSTLSQAYYVSGQYEKALRSAKEALKIAQERKAGDKNIQIYVHQIEKCQKAVMALSLMD